MPIECGYLALFPGGERVEPPLVVWSVLAFHPAALLHVACIIKFLCSAQLDFVCGPELHFGPAEQNFENLGLA